MKIRAVVEYNADGYLMFAENFVGAFTRGRTREESLKKFSAEIRSYLFWLGREGEFSEPCEVEIVQEKRSDLQICDADTDVLFEAELPPLKRDEYKALKALALKSAADFQKLYESVPDKHGTTLKPRKTFYGDVPKTAFEMYRHTMNVNSYYFGEIGVDAKNGPDILSCRKAGFAILEAQPDFLLNRAFTGSFGEVWTLRKMIRRFVWHDRIHAKAMFRMASALCGKDARRTPSGLRNRIFPLHPYKTDSRKRKKARL